MLTSPENKNLHVFAMCETKLKEHKLANTFKINGFHQPFRKDNLKSGGGGIIVYVRNDMNVKRRKILRLMI